jgi:hypothetical protein
MPERLCSLVEASSSAPGARAATGNSAARARQIRQPAAGVR